MKIPLLLFFIYLLLSIAIQNTHSFGIGNWKLEIGLVPDRVNSLFRSLYSLLKLLEYTFLFFFLSRAFSNKAIENCKLKIENFPLILSLPVLFESLLSIAQYIHQSSIGGIFYYFGERTFTSSTPGIANASINGQLILRPYGTLPHPNVLAGYLLLMLILISTNLFPKKNKPIKSNKSSYILHSTSYILPRSALLLGSIALLLTLSRITILLWAILSFGWLVHFIRNTKKKSPTLKNHWTLKIFIPLTFLIPTFLLWYPLFFRFSQTSLTEESFIQRKDLIQSSMQIIQHNPLFGVGLLNFLPTLANYKQSSPASYTLQPTTYFQPVHNIYLLWTAETGLIGLFFLLYFLIQTFRKLQKDNQLTTPYPLPPIPYAFFTLLILGLFDHYLLTLQQGQLLTTLILALVWSNKKEIS